MPYLSPPPTVAEGQYLYLSLDDLPVILTRSQGELRAYRNRCPHRNIALAPPDAASAGNARAGLLECVHHGAQFLVDTGECVSGPCTGEYLEALACELTEHALRIEVRED